LVHRRQLMDQWRERLAIFLGMPLEEIGQVSGGKKSGGRSKRSVGGGGKR
jgi:superfamily II DNA or RNA helicase